jgi:hypothetical protein
MKSVRNSKAAFLPSLVLSILLSGSVSGQNSGELERYTAKYPGNSVILASLREDIVFGIADGKPEAEIREFKEYVALNDNANFYADSKETFGTIHAFRDLEAYSLVPEKRGYRKIPVKSFKRSAETSGPSFYDDIYALNFSFPSVVRGTRMISRILTSSDDLSFPYKFYFGDFFPCDEYIFTVTCPEKMDLRYRIYGRDTSIINFDITRKGGKKVYTWRASNPKSYINDPLAPDFTYYIPHIIVQVGKFTDNKGVTTNINNSLDDLYKIVYQRINSLNLKVSEELKNLTDSVTGGTASDKEKVSKIFSWVQRNIKYVAFEDGANGFVPREASLVLQRKYGDCKDKTSILVAMMKTQGLKAGYAWIGTRDIPYKISEFGTASCFNHMIAVWWDENNKPVLLDGTTLYNLIDDLPYQIQGKECLIEKGPGNYLLYTVPVSEPEKNTVYDSLTVELRGDTLKGTGKTVIKGYRRSSLLDIIDGKAPAVLPEIVNKMMPKASNKFIIGSVNLEAKSEQETTAGYAYDFYLPDYLTTINNTSYLNLNLDRFPEGINLTDDRWIPVEVNSTIRHIFVCTFKIPEGYEIRDIPENSTYENKLFGYRHSYELNNRKLILRTVVTLNFQVIEGSDMVQFREMLTRLNRNYIKALPICKIASK